ncbi:hypothetical protein KGY64_03200, partial [Candidatus Bipolaricaulota bacterium]|nr:hypothetical protein [Candidatus Bipolaricaulota bacterium]
EIRNKQEELVEKALKKDKVLFENVFDLILKQLGGGGCTESDGGWFCPEMIETKGHLIAERIPLALEVLREEDLLERKVSMGVPHYRMK